MTSRETLRGRIGAEIAERWYIDALLGVGGSAAVYSATHRNGHRVAIKILHEDIASGDGGDRVVGAFLREGAVANRVAHPGIVPVFDDGFLPDGCPYLVMELLTGRTLDGIVRGKDAATSWQEATSVARAVGEVLVHAHATGLVHRDVKPANIFVCQADSPWFYPGRIRLLDFGIALADDVAPLSGALGTPAFLPPEQARSGLGRRGNGVGPHSDQWALAATALALLLGRPIRRGDTDAELLARTLQPVPPAAELGAVGPPEVLAVFDRALAFEPRDRYPSVAAFVEALDSAVHHAATWAPPAPISLDFEGGNAQRASVPGSLPPPNVNLLFSVWHEEVELPVRDDPPSTRVDSLVPTITVATVPNPRSSEITLPLEPRPTPDGGSPLATPRRPVIRRKT